MNREKTKEALVEILASSRKMTIVRACDRVNISPPTFYKWKEEDQKFEEKIEEVFDERIER